MNSLQASDESAGGSTSVGPLTVELRDRLRPWRLHAFDQLDSTNLHARRMREAGDLATPAIVWARHQTAGQGRGGNIWFSPLGSLTVTFAVPIDESLQSHLVPLHAGLLARRVIESVLMASGAKAAPVLIKWPNDIYVNGRKIAGILCQRIAASGAQPIDLIGIGINISPLPAATHAQIGRPVTSIAAEGAAVKPEDVLAHLAITLQREFLHTPKPWPVAAAEFRRFCHLSGRQVSIVVGPDMPPVTGTCRGIDDEGFLVVEGTAGRSRVVSGRVDIPETPEAAR